MSQVDHHARAELIWSMHQPWKASVGECLRRWHGLDPRWRTQSYLVVHGEGDARRTLDAAGITALVEGRAPMPAA